MPMPTLPPLAHSALFQEAWPACEGAMWGELGRSVGSPALRHFLVSCICAPEGGTPGTREVQCRDEERRKKGGRS